MYWYGMRTTATIWSSVYNMNVFATNDDTNLDNYVLQGIFNGGANLSFTQNMTSNGISYN